MIIEFYKDINAVKLNGIIKKKISKKRYPETIKRKEKTVKTVKFIQSEFTNQFQMKFRNVKLDI